MDIQEQITEQQVKLAALRALLKKDFSLWNAEERDSYGNKATASIEKDLVEVSIQLLLVEELFVKEFSDWNAVETRKYGLQEETAFVQLRKEKEQLRQEKEQLRQEKVLLLDLKLQTLNTEATNERKVTFEKATLDALRSIEITTKKNGYALGPLVDEYISKFYYTNKTKTKVSRGGRGDVFKKALLKYYFNIQKKVVHIKCMVSGIFFPSNVVIAGHLFKFCWAEFCDDRLGFSNIDNPRNGLLMFKPFEYAFDNSHVCFHYDSDMEMFKLKILLPDLKKMTIREYIKSEKEIDESSLLKSRDEWITELDKIGENSETASAVDELLAILDRPFADFEGLPVLSGLDGKKCFGRCLSFQASAAQHLALKKGWIAADEVSSPMFSDLAEEKKNQILAWIPDSSQTQPMPML